MKSKNTIIVLTCLERTPEQVLRTRPGPTGRIAAPGGKLDVGAEALRLRNAMTKHIHYEFERLRLDSNASA
jgi:hypothetical protein